VERIEPNEGSNVTKLAKRKRKPRTLKPAQMVAIKPTPLAAGIFGAALAAFRGESPIAVAETFVASAMHQTDTRRCQCGAFVLWRDDETPPICKCGADLATAPRATRADVRQVFEGWNKPKH
jgi:hypothetical protein